MPRGVIEPQKELRRAEVELEALRRQEEGVRLKITELEAVVRALKYFLRRDGSETEDTANGWVDLPRAQAVARVLQNTGDPLTPAAIAKVLREQGRTNDTPNGVSGSLWKFRQTGKAEPLPGGKGWLWIGAREESPPSDQSEELRLAE